jgi:colanic acid biosynthesis protein WcaH
MDLAQAIAAIGAHASMPAQGLPEDVFLLVSRLTPMVNVDLLIQNAAGETLLTWREDRFYGPGWHVPGGIVRFKEQIASRIAKVASTELGATVEAASAPLAVREMMNATRDTRGHFISLLYACRLTSPLDASRRFQGMPATHGQWGWHGNCPKELIRVHEVYRAFIDGDVRGAIAGPAAT